MMEDHEFCDDCPGCRPAMMDVKTGEQLGQDTPEMKAINEYWDSRTTYAQRKSFVEVTLHNSRNPVDLERCQQVMGEMQRILENL